MARELNPSRKIVYKQIGGRSLELHVFEPKDRPAEPCPAFVTFHGGGWAIGNPRRMYPWASWAAGQGMLGISVEYRLTKKGDEDATVFQCVQDARSALRYVRAHCRELNINPGRIIANGASAGGHLALATELFSGLDEPGEDTAVSCRPNALVLFSPVTDTTRAQKRIGARWRELSPVHRVTAQMPPALIFHGTGDTSVPFADAEAFHAAMIKAGARCELVLVKDAPHGYMFTDEAAYNETIHRMGVFLKEAGFMGSGADRRHRQPDFHQTPTPPANHDI